MHWTPGEPTLPNQLDRKCCRLAAEEEISSACQSDLYLYFYLYLYILWNIFLPTVTFALFIRHKKYASSSLPFIKTHRKCFKTQQYWSANFIFYIYSASNLLYSCHLNGSVNYIPSSYHTSDVTQKCLIIKRPSWNWQ